MLLGRTKIAIPTRRRKKQTVAYAGHSSHPVRVKEGTGADRRLVDRRLVEEGRRVGHTRVGHMLAELVVGTGEAGKRNSPYLET